MAAARMSMVALRGGANEEAPRARRAVESEGRHGHPSPVRAVASWYGHGAFTAPGHVEHRAERRAEGGQPGRQRTRTGGKRKTEKALRAEGKGPGPSGRTRGVSSAAAVEAREVLFGSRYNYSVIEILTSLIINYSVK